MKDKTDVIRKRIYVARKKLEYSQEFVANELEISQRQYSMIENGQVLLVMDTLVKIAVALELDIKELLAGL